MSRFREAGSCRAAVSTRPSRRLLARGILSGAIVRRCRHRAAAPTGRRGEKSPHRPGGRSSPSPRGRPSSACGENACPPPSPSRISGAVLIPESVVWCSHGGVRGADRSSSISRSSGAECTLVAGTDPLVSIDNLPVHLASPHPTRPGSPRRIARVSGSGRRPYDHLAPVRESRRHGRSCTSSAPSAPGRGTRRVFAGPREVPRSSIVGMFLIGRIRNARQLLRPCSPRAITPVSGPTYLAKQLVRSAADPGDRRLPGEPAALSFRRDRRLEPRRDG